MGLFKKEAVAEWLTRLAVNQIPLRSRWFESNPPHCDAVAARLQQNGNNVDRRFTKHL